MKHDDKNHNEDIEETNEPEETKGRDSSEIGALQQKVADFENRYKRALADYQNLEKRSVQDRQNFVQLANKEIILRLLPVLDTLMMATKHVDDQGLQLCIQQFLQALKDEGVERIETKGKPFDPHTMEVVQTVEGKEGKVVEELRAGYTMAGTVIRPAQVVVGKSS